MSHSRLSILAISMLMALPLSAQISNSYMHQSTDANATVVDFAKFEADVAAGSSLFSNEIFKNPGRENVSGPVIAVPAGTIIDLPASLLSRVDLANARGHVVRFHLWMKGEETGQNGDLWNSAPAVRFVVQDSFDTRINEVESSFKTRGTFPWFCYYVDVEIPAQLNLGGAETDDSAIRLDDEYTDFDLASHEAAPSALSGAGIFASLENPTSGTAYFASFSWEILKQQVPEAVSEIGSRAPNPEYDELPVHLFFGIDAAKPESWKFLSGNQVFQNIMTVAGLNEYLKCAANDWFSLIYGAANLLELKKCSQFAEASLTFEEGWEDALRSFLLRKQDPETGLWLINEQPDILVSQAIAEKIFAGSELPYAAKIAGTLLKHRAGNEKQGRFWNQYVFAAEGVGGEDASSLCQLGTTTAAALLLRQCISQLDDNQAAEAWNAIDEAVDYVMANLVRENGTWVQNSQDGMATSPAFMMQLLNASRLLDARVNEKLALPELKAEMSPAGNKLTVEISALPKNLKSIRVYSIAAEEDVKNVSKAKLLAVIQPVSRTIDEMDPILALMKIGEGARKRWGSDATWVRQGADSLNARLTKLNVQVLNLSKKVAVKIPSLPGADVSSSRVIFVVGVNGRGEVSLPMIISGDTPEEAENQSNGALPQEE